MGESPGSTDSLNSHPCILLYVDNGRTWIVIKMYYRRLSPVINCTFASDCVTTHITPVLLPRVSARSISQITQQQLARWNLVNIINFPEFFNMGRAICQTTALVRHSYSLLASFCSECNVNVNNKVIECEGTKVSNALVLSSVLSKQESF